MRNTLYMSAAYTLIAVGAITIIISFLGCMGSLSLKCCGIENNSTIGRPWEAW